MIYNHEKFKKQTRKVQLWPCPQLKYLWFTCKLSQRNQDIKARTFRLKWESKLTVCRGWGCQSSCGVMNHFLEQCRSRSNYCLILLRTLWRILRLISAPLFSGWAGYFVLFLWQRCTDYFWMKNQDASDTLAILQLPDFEQPVPLSSTSIPEKVGNRISNWNQPQISVD